MERSFVAFLNALRTGSYVMGAPHKGKGRRFSLNGGGITLSTRPKTPEGRKAIAEATRQRMASGGRIRALAGFYRWLEGGGREMLSKLAKNREKRTRWKRLMLESTHASHTGA
jgi:hypothetical protein